jgi:hypothetical protein
MQLASGQEVLNTIYFEKSKTGFLFTTVFLDGKNVKAMIDFGDPGELMLSSSFVEEQMISTRPTSLRMMDVNGNEYILEEGEVSKVRIGDQVLPKVKFLTAEGEIEKVASLVKQDFDAVVGFGFISRSAFVLDYRAGSIQQYASPRKLEGISCPYDDSQGYLIIKGKVNNLDVAMLIDTGSAVSVVDSHLDLDESDMQLTIGAEQVDVELLRQDLTQLSGLADVVLGGDILSNYRLHFDPGSKVVVFEENK